MQLDFIATGPISILIHSYLLTKYGLTLAAIGSFYLSWLFFILLFHWRIGQGQPEIIIRAELLRAVLNLGALGSLLLWSDLSSAEMLIWASTVATTASSLILIPNVRPTFRNPEYKNLLYSSLKHDWPAMVWFLAATALFWLDRIAIESKVSDQLLAIYVLMSDLIQRGTQLLYGSIVVTVQPYIAEQARNGPQDAISSLRIGLILHLALTSAAVVFIWLLADPILTVLVADDAPQAASVIWSLFAAYALWQFAQVIQKPLEYGGWLGFVCCVGCLAACGVYMLAGALVATNGITAGALALSVVCLLYTLSIAAGLIVWKGRYPKT